MSRVCRYRQRQDLQRYGALAYLHSKGAGIQLSWHRFISLVACTLRW